MTIQEAYQEATLRLTTGYAATEAAIMADMLMEHITGLRKMDRLLNKMETISMEQMANHENAMQQLLMHRPIQYVIGKAWFADMEFQVNKHVLIPRPETEELVEEVVRCITPAAIVLDIGTGSGCIPISIKKKLPNAVVHSIDVSDGALEVAKKNAENLMAEVDFKLIDFLDEHNWQHLGNYDCIVSNPPYIKQSESLYMHENVLQYEPHLALFVMDDDALLFYRKIAAFGKAHLNADGIVCCEINEALGKETVQLFESYGYSAALIKDMQGKDRIVKASIKQ